MLSGITQIEEDVEDNVNFIATDDLELMYESVGFHKMKEALDKIPPLDEGYYYVQILLNQKYKGNIAFNNVIISKIYDKSNLDSLFEFYFELTNEQQSLRIYKKIK